MSTRRHQRVRHDLRTWAPVFAALGDETRLALVTRLSEGRRVSIKSLTQDTALTRQAVTKHLRVLEDAGIVRKVTHGRERLFELKPEAIDEAQQALHEVSKQWDQALARLKSFVES